MGGRVLIYIRSYINHNIRNDIVPPELEAIYTCIEIMKQFSYLFIAALKIYWSSYKSLRNKVNIGLKKLRKISFHC